MVVIMFLKLTDLIYKNVVRV